MKDGGDTRTLEQKERQRTTFFFQNFGIFMVIVETGWHFLAREFSLAEFPKSLSSLHIEYLAPSLEKELKITIIIIITFIDKTKAQVC